MPVLTETTDAAAATSTTYSMAVGDYFFGTLGTTLDSDWVRVDLTAGQTYTFGLVGVGALTDNLDDSYLRLRNSAGSQIAFDDDGGPGFNSALTFTATTTGTYYLDVQSYNNSKAGDYGLSVTLGSKASYDVEMGAGVMLRPDASWAGSPGTGATVSWGIRATGPEPGGQAYDAEGVLTSYIVPSAAQAAAAQDVLAMFGGISGLSFTQVNPGGTTDSATMLFGAYSSDTDGAGAFAYFPGSTASTANAGDVWLNNNSVSQTSLPQGSFSHFAILHEVGHAVGLAHPGDYNAAPGVPITYAANAQFIEDSHQYTVMSYFDESNTTSSFSSYPDTLLLYDIYALHQQYGADYSFHAGNTTYGFNATVGGAYDFTTNVIPVLSIWDGSGTDTLDVSGFSTDQLINLNAGEFSDIGGYVDNVSIAIGAVIENAVGGSGNDTIIGNEVSNVIAGGGGNDELLGGGGDDRFNLSINNSGEIDTVDGGAGNSDTVEFIGFGSAIWADLDYAGIEVWTKDAADARSGGFYRAITDLANVENLTGTAYHDFLSGDDGANIIKGGGGNDELLGGGGNDTLLDGTGSDFLDGGTGNDRFLLWASTPGDFDVVDGGGGGDTVDFSSFGAAVWVSLRYAGTSAWTKDTNEAIQTAGPWRAIADLSQIDHVTGTNFDDWLEGDAGGNILVGGGGSDVFVFTDGHGSDRINGFEATNNTEVIDLSGVSTITDFGDLRDNHMSQSGNDVLIDTGSGTIRLTGVQLSDLLDGNDFVF